MLPRPGRTYDQFLRTTVVAGIGGLVIGHILWLIAISIAIATTSVSRWVLIVTSVFVAISVITLVQGWRMYRKQSDVWAAFLLCLPISPVLLSLSVLGITYL